MFLPLITLKEYEMNAAAALPQPPSSIVSDITGKSGTSTAADNKSKQHLLFSSALWPLCNTTTVAAQGVQ